MLFFGILHIVNKTEPFELNWLLQLQLIGDGKIFYKWWSLLKVRPHLVVRRRQLSLDVSVDADELTGFSPNVFVFKERVFFYKFRLEFK